MAAQGLEDGTGTPVFACVPSVVATGTAMGTAEAAAEGAGLAGTSSAMAADTLSTRVMAADTAVAAAVAMVIDATDVLRAVACIRVASVATPWVSLDGGAFQECQDRDTKADAQPTGLCS